MDATETLPGCGNFLSVVWSEGYHLRRLLFCSIVFSPPLPWFEFAFAWPALFLHPYPFIPPVDVEDGTTLAFIVLARAMRHRQLKISPVVSTAQLLFVSTLAVMHLSCLFLHFLLPEAQHSRRLYIIYDWFFFPLLYTPPSSRLAALF